MGIHPHPPSPVFCRLSTSFVDKIVQYLHYVSVRAQVLPNPSLPFHCLLSSHWIHPITRPILLPWVALYSSSRRPPSSVVVRDSEKMAIPARGWRMELSTHSVFLTCPPNKHHNPICKGHISQSVSQFIFIQSVRLGVSLSLSLARTKLLNKGTEGATQSIHLLAYITEQIMGCSSASYSSSGRPYHIFRDII